MFRWDEVNSVTVNGIDMKFYREPFSATSTITANANGRELDDLALKYLGIETEMYKVLDVNFIDFMENRFDRSRIKKVLIPNE